MKRKKEEEINRGGFFSTFFCCCSPSTFPALIPYIYRKKKKLRKSQRKVKFLFTELIKDVTLQSSTVIDNATESKADIPHISKISIRKKEGIFMSLLCSQKCHKIL